MNIDIGIISILVLLVGQIIAFSFSYGKLSQKVDGLNTLVKNLCQRVDALDCRVRKLEVITGQLPEK